MSMKEVVSRVSTYSADTFGVCSALFELGGMTVIHDPSGCNSTYTTHDEPRWYHSDSLIFITGLTEKDAVLGNEEKMIQDVLQAADTYKPRFITLLCTPVPLMMGTDFKGMAKLIEEKAQVPVFWATTNSMNTYEKGISWAYAMIAERLVTAPKTPSTCCSWQPSFASTGQGNKINIIGMTPLDFALNGSEKALRRCLTRMGLVVTSIWSMGSVYEEIIGSAMADVNLVVSYGGERAAKILQQRFAQPYVVGIPLYPIQSVLEKSIYKAIETKRVQYPLVEIRAKKKGEHVILGESVYATSIAAAWEQCTGQHMDVFCPVTPAKGTLLETDWQITSEGELMERLQSYKMIIADPLYKAIIPSSATFVPLGHEAFSGRMYQDDIPNLMKAFNDFFATYIESVNRHGNE